MRAFQAGASFCQGLLEVVSRAAALSCSTTAQQCPSLIRQGAAAVQTQSVATSSILSQVSAWQVLDRNLSISSSCIKTSRSFSALARAPNCLQQQQQHHMLLELGRLPCQPAFQSDLQRQHLVPQLGGVRTFVMMPRRIKYRKAHKSMGFNETICPNTRQLAFGLYGIRAMEHCRIPAKTIEAARRTLRRNIKKTAMLWIRITPNVPVTSKPAEVRMGKGKGTLDYWAAPIRPGQILFEMDRCSRTDALAALQSIQAKMPIKVGFVEWN